MDYSIDRFSDRFASSVDSDMTALPSTSMPRKLETTFCRDFTCCGQALDDLHDLLQHYEECHVRFEDDDMPTMMSDDDHSGSSSSASSSSQPPSPRAPSARRSADFDDASAFPAVAGAAGLKGKKRSFGQYSSGTSNSAVHQSLRRALIDGGVGRAGAGGAPSIYSVNSPFSTPDSSIPGTPIGDADDAAFFGGVTPSFSSLSLRGGFDAENTLPSCAPPNLFFPSGGSGAAASAAQQPPTKRERINTAGAAVAAGAAPESHISRPGATLVVDKPFKCPAPGCDKAYKQMNGLKYHRLHGHCNQNNLPPSQQMQQTPAGSRAATPTRPVAGSPARPTINTGVAAKAGAASPALSGTPTPTSSAPTSPRTAATAALAANTEYKVEKMYLCQVGACGKRYKNLNGLRYHYLHSGSHGMLGLALLSSNGGGQSARVDGATGRPAVSTNTLTSAQLAAAAQAAVAAQNAARPVPANQAAQAAKAALAARPMAPVAGAAPVKPAGVAAAPAPAAPRPMVSAAPAVSSMPKTVSAPAVNATIAHPSLPLGPSPKLA
jgi:transcription factor SFP1